MYRAIVDVFTEAAAGYASRLRPEDVRAALAGRFGPGPSDPDAPELTLADVEARLSQLAEWGNLDRDYDSSRAASLEAYERTAYVYDLTPGGEAAHEALLALEDGLRRVGGLQSVALHQIEEMLTDLVALHSDPDPDGARVYAVCEDLHTRFRSLTGNAALFMQKVNRVLSSSLLDVADFTLFKADTIAYLNDFIGDLETTSAQIRTRLGELDAAGPLARQRTLEAGAAASGQIALDGRDSGSTQAGSSGNGSSTGAGSWAAVAATHLDGTADWFHAGETERSGAAVLYVKARDAILGIARAVDHIREAAASPSSRSTDLLRLATWFSEAPRDADAHRLWHASFGLTSARHLGTVADGDATATTSWWEDASAVPVSFRLRYGGQTDYVRRATLVPDRRAGKRMVALEAAAELDQAAGATDRLVALGTFRVSELNDRLGGPVDAAVLRTLARLVGRAIQGTQMPDGTRRARSVDGAQAITLAEPRPPLATVVRATTGTWTLPDYTIRLQPRHGDATPSLRPPSLRATGDATPAATADENDDMDGRKAVTTADDTPRLDWAERTPGSGQGTAGEYAEPVVAR